ncbi:MAG: sugar phosphate isomerase/epimerase family protein, partial [Bryobacteraceae bacterium]
MPVAPTIRDREIGMLFWAGRDTVDQLIALGAHCGQIGVGGDVDITPGFLSEWQAASAEFPLYTVVAAYIGEHYNDIATVQRTVGFIPPATRAAREARTLEIADLAAALGIPGIACHIGFVPEDHFDADHIAVREMVRRICDRCATYGQTFALETGQETAPVLKAFIADVGRPNLKINFDPANMILYGTGDPIEALQLLAPDVVSVHCKDGDWPDKSKPGTLGTERPLGKGSVGMQRFVDTLKSFGYTAPLFIERESV